MNDARIRAIEFLNSNFMDFRQIDMESLCHGFITEMERGLAGKPSSLRMIPTYIGVENAIPTGRPVIAMDAGGTNFRVAVVSFGADGKPLIEHFRKFPMPGVKAEVDSKTFFATIAGYLGEVAGLSDDIGFCFSYPTEILENRDGRLLRFSKEVKAPEVCGQLIGENLNRALAASGIKKSKRIVLLNDTVATLLAGKSASGRSYDSYIGFILGTGTNCSYAESNAAILKKTGLDPARQQIVNVESGDFGRVPRGLIDLEFDSGTVDPGTYVLEKMISGAYLGGLYRAVISKAAREGLFSEATADRIGALRQLETKDLGSFLADPARGQVAGLFSDDADFGLGFHLAERIVERAAKLTAVNIASIAIKTGSGTDPRRPICVNADGTTFYELKGLKLKTERYLDSFLTEGRGQHLEFAKVENAPLIGAAIAGLTND